MIVNETAIDTVQQDIFTERVRQEMLKQRGKFAFTCADAGISNGDRYSVLGEEFGEVGKELNEGIGADRSVDLVKLRAELIQVAAVCVAWCEAIDGGRAGK